MHSISLTLNQLKSAKAKDQLCLPLHFGFNPLSIVNRLVAKISCVTPQNCQKKKGEGKRFSLGHVHPTWTPSAALPKTTLRMSVFLSVAKKSSKSLGNSSALCTSPTSLLVTPTSVVPQMSQQFVATVGNCRAAQKFSTVFAPQLTVAGDFPDWLESPWRLKVCNEMRLAPVQCIKEGGGFPRDFHP